MAPTVTYGLATHPDPDEVYDAVRLSTNGHEIEVDREPERLYTTDVPAEIRVLDGHPALVRVAVSDPAAELAKLTRAQLDEQAATAGVDAAESLPSKQAVIDAILAAEGEVSA